jgi:hypothetical protein
MAQPLRSPLAHVAFGREPSLERPHRHHRLYEVSCCRRGGSPSEPPNSSLGAELADRWYLSENYCAPSSRPAAPRSRVRPPGRRTLTTAAIDAAVDATTSDPGSRE